MTAREALDAMARDFMSSHRLNLRGHCACGVKPGRDVEAVMAHMLDVTLSEAPRYGLQITLADK